MKKDAVRGCSVEDLSLKFRRIFNSCQRIGPYVLASVCAYFSPFLTKVNHRNLTPLVPHPSALRILYAHHLRHEATNSASLQATTVRRSYMLDCGATFIIGANAQLYGMCHQSPLSQMLVVLTCRCRSNYVSEHRPDYASCFYHYVQY